MAQQPQQAQHVQQVQHAQQAQHRPQHVIASCQDGGEEKHTSALTAGHIGQAQQDSLLHHYQPPTQHVHHSQPHVKDLHHSQPHMRDLDQFQPQIDGVHDGQSQIQDERNDWRQQGSLPVAQWLNQADDASRCVPGPDCSAPGHMAGLDENALGIAPANAQQVNNAPLNSANITCFLPHLGLRALGQAQLSSL